MVPGWGTRFREARLAKNMSQDDVAASAGVSKGQVSLVENEKLKRPGKVHLDAIARALGFDSAEHLLRPGVEREQQPSPVPMESNVRGRLEDLRAPGVQPLPIYRWGSCGDPRSRESAPDPDRLEYPPIGKELLIGPNGFGVEIEGESMANRGIHGGDVVWVNPDRAVRQGGIVLALVDMDGDPGMVVKVLSSSTGAIGLESDGNGDDGRADLLADHITVIGPVVLVSPRSFAPR